MKHGAFVGEFADSCGNIGKLFNADACSCMDFQMVHKQYQLRSNDDAEAKNWSK
jgi:hypothetical protein